jgi:histidinol phosphatase-like PHP family hydrolase
MDILKHFSPEEKPAERIDVTTAARIRREWFSLLRGPGHVHSELSSLTGIPGEARHSPEQIFDYLERIVDQGEQKFTDYFIVTDHVSSAEVPQKITKEKAKLFLEQKKKFEELNKEHRIKAVVGVEASFISEDGKIDLPDEVAEQMDLVIASMHNFPERDERGQPILDEKNKPIYKKRTVEEKTQLYENVFLGAAKNPYVDVIGHPTRHQPIEVLRAIDWDKIFSEAGKTGTAIEINLHDPMVPVWPMEKPQRENFESDEKYQKSLENYDKHLEYCNFLREILRKAVEQKVKFFIGTDWHKLKQFWQPFRSFTSDQFDLMAKKFRREARGEKLDSKEQERYDRFVTPKLEKLSSEEREMILRIARGELKPEELKKIDEERLKKTPGPKFWLRYERVILELEKAGVRPEDIINTSRENLLKFCQTSKGQR